MGIIAFLVVINIVAIVVCHTIAKKRGARPVFWGLMGALFSVFAIPFAMRSKPEAQS